jgi:hypothetical protein
LGRERKKERNGRVSLRDRNWARDRFSWRNGYVPGLFLNFVMSKFGQIFINSKISRTYTRTSGVSPCGLAIYIKRYLKEKEEL